MLAILSLKASVSLSPHRTHKHSPPPHKKSLLNGHRTSNSNRIRVARVSVFLAAVVTMSLALNEVLPHLAYTGRQPPPPTGSCPLWPTPSDSPPPGVREDNSLRGVVALPPVRFVGPDVPPGYYYRLAVPGAQPLCDGLHPVGP